MTEGETTLAEMEAYIEKKMTGDLDHDIAILSAIIVAASGAALEHYGAGAAMGLMAGVSDLMNKGISEGFAELKRRELAGDRS